MKKFNFKKIGITVLSFVLVTTVFISCFAFSASAASPMDEYDLSIYTDSFAAFGVNNAKNAFYSGYVPAPPDPPYLDFTPAVFFHRLNQTQDLGYNGASSYFYLPKIDTNKWQGRIWFSRTNSNDYNDSSAWNKAFLSNKQKLLFTVGKGYTVKALFVFFMPYVSDNELLANNFSVDFYDQDDSLGINSNFVVKGVYASEWNLPQPWDPYPLGSATYTGQWVVLECTYVTEERQSISSVNFTFQNYSSSVDGFLFDSFMMFLAISPDGTWGGTQQIIQNVNNNSSNLIERIGGWFTTLFDNISAFFNKIVSWFSNLSFSDLVDSINDWFYDVWSTISNGFSNIGGFFASLSNWLTSLGDRIGQFFDNLWYNISDGFESIVSLLGGVFKYLSDVVVNIIIGAIRSFGNIIISLNELTLIQEGKPLPNVEPQLV